MDTAWQQKETSEEYDFDPEFDLTDEEREEMEAEIAADLDMELDRHLAHLAAVRAEGFVTRDAVSEGEPF